MQLSRVTSMPQLTGGQQCVRTARMPRRSAPPRQLHSWRPFVGVVRAAGSSRSDQDPMQGPVEPETDFDRETTKLAVRMLTARAAAVVLQNISQVDTFKATWLQDYCSKHPPIEGNAFLAGLLEARPEVHPDAASGATHSINPAAIAAAVLSTREALAEQLAKTLSGKVARANVSLMRTHLERHTYVSGTNEEVKPSFKQQRRRRSGQRQLQK